MLSWPINAASNDLGAIFRRSVLRHVCPTTVNLREFVFSTFGALATGTSLVQFCISCKCSRPYEKTPRKIIRRCARLATRYNTKFFVLYVQTPKEDPDRISLADQRHLLNHFKLATELGGEVIQVHSPHILESIIKEKKKKQITTICTGIPALKLPKTIFTVSKYKNFMKSLSENNIDLIILA